MDCWRMEEKAGNLFSVVTIASPDMSFARTYAVKSLRHEATRNFMRNMAAR